MITEEMSDAEDCVPVLITVEYLRLGRDKTPVSTARRLIICNTSAHTGQKITPRMSSHKL